MPNLTTHIHFALLFCERAKYDIHLPSLFEGAIGPGFHSGQYANAQYHDADTDILNEESGIASLSYRLGYLSHSFLDHYFDAYRAEIFLFMSPLKEERMRRVSMAEQIDIRHMKEHETVLKSLSQKYGGEFTALYHAVSESEGRYTEIERDYEDLMTGLAEKFTQFLKALNFTSASDDLIP